MRVNSSQGARKRLDSRGWQSALTLCHAQLRPISAEPSCHCDDIRNVASIFLVYVVNLGLMWQVGDDRVHVRDYSVFSVSVLGARIPLLGRIVDSHAQLPPRQRRVVRSRWLMTVLTGFAPFITALAVHEAPQQLQAKDPCLAVRSSARR
jgi:hypothetical protein